jgi:DNA polymerase-3 subunit delta'
MDFSAIIGQDFLKKYFKKIIENNRIPHTQMFVGDEGTGTLPMALAFAQTLLCKENKNCINKVQKFIHPDLHFVFPNITTDKLKKPKSDDFLNEWRTFLNKNPYASLYDWHKFLEVANKQGIIRVADADNIIKKVAVKPYEADYKIVVIWMVEKMNLETANKLLKILEEPPEDTKFILIAENTDDILPTILSRCQIHQFNPIPTGEIKKQLIEKYNLPVEKAMKIAHQSNGNWNKALELAQNHQPDDEFQKLFISWVRTAFTAKKNKKSIQELIAWSEKLATKGREYQKQFLEFALQTFRQAMLINYQNKNLAFFDFSNNRFDLNKLAPFIHSDNIEAFYQFITDAIYHIERNANPKLIFLNLSIKLTKLIHIKEKSL